jgi:hypothetical protein
LSLFLLLAVPAGASASGTVSIDLPASAERGDEVSFNVAGQTTSSFGQMQVFVMPVGAACPETPEAAGSAGTSAGGSDVTGEFSWQGSFRSEEVGPRSACAYLQEYPDADRYEGGVLVATASDTFEGRERTSPPSIELLAAVPGEPEIRFSGRAQAGGNGLLAVFTTRKPACAPWNRDTYRYGSYRRIGSRDVTGGYVTGFRAPHLIPGSHRVCAFLLDGPDYLTAAASLSATFVRDFGSWVPAGSGVKPRAGRWKGTAVQSYDLTGHFQPFAAAKRGVSFEVKRGRVRSISVPTETACDVEGADRLIRFSFGRKTKLKVTGGRVSARLDSAGDQLFLEGRFVTAKTFLGRFAFSQERGFDVIDQEPGYCTGVTNFKARFRRK